MLIDALEPAVHRLPDAADGLAGENLAQLSGSAARPGTPASASATIAERILAVCKELGVSRQRSGG